MARGFWRWVGAALAIAVLQPSRFVAQTENGRFARIAMLRPHDGDTVDFEAGYMRHLAWHQQMGDKWVWYGWTVTFGERQQWFVYATFGHSARSLDASVSPADDERDNILNVTPHAQFAGNALYEYRPAISRGTGIPTPNARLELVTVDLNPGSEQAFEAALAASQSILRGEALWFRMIAGGTAPRYVKLSPRPNLADILDESRDGGLPDAAGSLIAKTTIEILSLRPTMSLGLAPVRQ